MNAIISKEFVIQSTIEAMANIRNTRFYKSERGYQGEFHRLIASLLNIEGLENDGIILENEYQKRLIIHRTRQRPDLIMHIPREITNDSPDENNITVWAFKIQSNLDNALNDFAKLEEMFEYLNYSYGIFINISSSDNFLSHYSGQYNDRIFSFATKIRSDVIEILSGEYKEEDVVNRLFQYKIG